MLLEQFSFYNGFAAFIRCELHFPCALFRVSHIILAVHHIFGTTFFSLSLVAHFPLSPISISLIQPICDFIPSLVSGKLLLCLFRAII